VDQRAEGGGADDEVIPETFCLTKVDRRRADQWRQMTLLAGRLNFGHLPLEDAFRNAAVSRNNAAHTASTDISSSELESQHRSAIAVALTFDALLSRSVFKIHRGIAGATAEPEIVVRGIHLRRPLEWEERIVSRATAVRVHRSSVDYAGALGRAAARNELVVVFDAAGIPERWWTSDIP